MKRTLTTSKQKEEIIAYRTKKVKKETIEQIIAMIILVALMFGIFSM